MKFETVRIYLLSEFSVPVVSSKNVATMATWRNDFSSLFIVERSLSSK